MPLQSGINQPRLCEKKSHIMVYTDTLRLIVEVCDRYTLFIKQYVKLRGPWLKDSRLKDDNELLIIDVIHGCISDHAVRVGRKT